MHYANPLIIHVRLFKCNNSRIHNCTWETLYFVQEIQCVCRNLVNKIRPVWIWYIYTGASIPWSRYKEIQNVQVGTGYIVFVALIPRQCGQKRRQRASLQKGFRDRGLNKISPRRCLRSNLSSRPPACPNQISKSKYKQLAQFRLHIYIEPGKRGNVQKTSTSPDRFA